MAELASYAVNETNSRGRKMAETVQTTPTNQVATTKTEENKTEPTKDETVNPDDIPF